MLSSIVGVVVLALTGRAGIFCFLPKLPTLLLVEVKWALGDSGFHLASELNSSLSFLIWKTEIGILHLCPIPLSLVTHTPGHWWQVSYNKNKLLRAVPPQTLKLQRYTIYRVPKFTQINIDIFFLINFFLSGYKMTLPSVLPFYIKTPLHTLKY
jgi:hypothetical protein